MSESKTELSGPDLWIRLIYMILFWLLSFLARVVIAIVAGIQFVVVLFSGEVNHNLRDLGSSIAIWTRQNYDFLSFASEAKPFPFQDWPEPEQAADDEADSVESEPVPTLTDAAEDSESTNKPD